MKLLFIINPGSGSKDLNMREVISSHFEKKDTEIDLYELPENCSLDKIKQRIKRSASDRVIAVGGDGTLKLVAECLLKSKTPIGIIPAGSANGMAKELGIPTDIELALDVAEKGTPKKFMLYS